MHASGKFSIPEIRNFVPEALKPWIVLAFVLVFQLSGGVYLAAVSEIVGSTALMQEDIMMAGYASLVGLALTFTVMFRLKFRFSSKVCYTTCATGLILCNIVAMHTHSVPVLVGVCFVAGIFRMWATFGCNTIIQLWITPKRDLTVWFCYIELLVQASIQLSGMTTSYVAFLSNWESMHWFVIGLLLAVILLSMLLFRAFRAIRLPLYGIDWLGAALWATTVLSILFIALYGEHYDWLDSEHIRAAIAIAALSLGLNLWRASFIRHPYIELETWRYREVWMTLVIYLIFELLLSPAHLFEHIYFEAVLGYDSLHVASLNIAVLAGVVGGALFAWRTFSKRKWSYKFTTAVAFMSLTAYLAICYFMIDYNLPKGMLVLPLMLRSAGHVILGICFLTILGRIPVFPRFAQALSVQAFVSAVLGGAIGTAVLSQLFERVMASNAATLSMTLDRVNPAVAKMPFGAAYGQLQEQALLVSMKEIYGWLTIGAIFCLLFFLIRESDIRPYKVIHPTFRAIRRLLRRDVDAEIQTEESLAK